MRKTVKNELLKKKLFCVVQQIFRTLIENITIQQGSFPLTPLFVTNYGCRFAVGKIKLLIN